MALATSEIAVEPARRTGRRRLLRREAVYGFLFISPWLIGFAVFTAFPMLYGAYLSFTDYDGLTSPHWIGLDNYHRLFSGDDQLVVKAIRNTFWYVFVSVPASLVAGLVLALLLKRHVRGIALYRTLFYMPSVVPVVASISVLSWVFHGRFGLVNVLLDKVGVLGPAWLTDPQWVKPTLVLWTVWGVGGGMIIYLAGLQSIPQHLYEAAELDGAGPFRKFFNITIPMLSPTIFFNLIVGLITAFQVFVPALLLSGNNLFSPAGGPLNSLLFYVLYVWQNAFVYYRMGYAAALSWVLFVAVLAITIVLFRFARHWVYYETEGR
jgi:multiple sugar transport system permease protein